MYGRWSEESEDDSSFGLCTGTGIGAVIDMTD